MLPCSNPSRACFFGSPRRVAEILAEFIQYKVLCCLDFFFSKPNSFSRHTCRDAQCTAAVQRATFRAL